MRGGCIGFFGLPALFVGGDRIIVVALHIPVHLWVMTSSACIFCSFKFKSRKGGVHPALNLGWHHVIIPQCVGGWTGPYWFIVEDLLSSFTHVAFLHPSEWNFPSPPSLTTVVLQLAPTSAFLPPLLE
eukprot:Gb_28710 [translate_table: standard]